MSTESPVAIRTNSTPRRTFTEAPHGNPRHFANGRYQNAKIVARNPSRSDARTGPGQSAKT